MARKKHNTSTSDDNLNSSNIAAAAAFSFFHSLFSIFMERLTFHLHKKTFLPHFPFLFFYMKHFDCWKIKQDSCKNVSFCFEGCGRELGQRTRCAMFEFFFLVGRSVSNASETEAPLIWNEYVEVIQYRV